MRIGLGVVVGMGGGMRSIAWSFDQGSYSAFAEVSADVYRITPYISDYGSWAWWALRSGGFAGKTPHFLIAKADHFSLGAGMWLARWASAADTDTWYAFDNVSIGAVDIEFYNNSAFPAGTIYISALPMYPFSRVQRKVVEWMADAYVGDTISATDGVIGLSTARTEPGLGRSIPALPFYGFKISSGAGDKNNIILTTNSHATETPGAFAFEAAIDWLLAGSLAAEAMLDYCNFYVYPATNPQGVHTGWFRSSPEVPATSHDWLWDAGSVGTDESVDAHKTAMSADTGGAIEAGFDYHAYYTNTDIHGAVNTGDTTGDYAAYLAEMAALDAAFNLDEMDLSKASAVFFKSLGGMGMTLEQGLGTARDITQWKAFGQNTRKALSAMTAKGYFTQGPGTGSRDYNGTTNRIDWASVSNLSGHALTISLWAYADTYVANGYLLCIHDSGNTSFGMIVNTSSSAPNYGYVSFLVNGTTDMQRASIIGALPTGSWVNLIITWDGVFTASTGVKIYKNGVEMTYSVETNGATETAHTGSWSTGGRIYDDARNFDGKLAQVSVWDRVLSSTEIANLAAGHSPDTIASGLVFYHKGNTSSLTASPGGDGTADGTTQLTGAGTGPGIYYP
jgi:hypothetical protein